MSKSEDNTNELESYGVWVKNTSSNDISQANDQADNIDENIDDIGLDLPDFDDEDFSDMFKDDSQFNSSEQEDTFGGDSTLSTDELANITDIASDSVSDIDIEENFEQNVDEETSISPDELIEESVDTAEDQEPIFDDTTNQSSDLAENVDDEEISLDDFMDEGFSDESVASGNNGYEPGKESAVSTTDTEELSLDDFLDGETFEENNTEKEEVIEENPIDMDISFDDSIEAVETEENLSIDVDELDESDDNSKLDEIETEEVSFDDFDITAETPVENEIEDTIAEASSNDTVNFDTEEIDLSDFGIDEEAEETPVVQDMETQKTKDKVVDYDLFIGNEAPSTAPVVNEIKEEDTQTVTEETVSAEPVDNNTTAVDNSLLQQIVADLSNLKNEINDLKTNIAEIKATENNIEQEIAIPEEKDEGGFFSADDTDDTIALSGDELSNIMNNADFGDSEDIQNNVDDDEVLDIEPEVIEEPEEFEIAETTIDETEIQEDNDVEDDLSFDYEDKKLEEPTFDNLENSIDIEEENENEDIPEEIAIPKEENDIFVESTSTDFMDSVKDSTEQDIISTDSLEEMEEISNLEKEETFDEIVEGLDLNEVEDAEIIESEAEEQITSDEITIPSVEEIENSIDDPSAVENNEDEIDDVPTVDMLLNTQTNESEEEIIKDETTDFSPSITDEETEALTSNENDDFSSVDNLNDDLSNSNIDYLTSDDNKQDYSEVSPNNDLKQEIKSVLLYMDQLLENLPEDKIYEFAKSDEFATYKKLFKDLGLS